MKSFKVRVTYMTDNPENSRQQDSLITAEENRSMFDSIAGYYDGTNKILSFGLDGLWRRRAVNRLRPVPKGRYLDVGCGTGDVALEILRQAPGSKVVGIDPSQGMLLLGQQKIESVRLTDSISLLVGDALDLRFEDDSFDGAITSFCIRNVTDRKLGLREMRRVVRPGGRVVILELTQPTGRIMGPLFRTYARVVVPVLTKIMSSVSAYRYLTDSMVDFPRPELILGLMKEAGFVERRYAHMSGGIVTLFEGQAEASNKQ
jgi:demethylmenaquinone methyltransferase / 2-methoxy-6-polyprenyl-1,4-benzoquinol methylase